MNYSKRSLLNAGFSVFMLVFFCLVSLPAATAQDAQTPDRQYQQYELGEVVVSSERETFGNPTTISEVTGAEIRDLNAGNLGKAIRAVTGVYFRQGRAKQESYATVRGFEQDKVLILLDGTPIYQPYEGLVNLSDIPVQNIAKIKVIKGLSSSLYGPNAMGGVINIITKKGVIEPHTEVSYKISEYNTHHVEATHGRRIGDISYFFGFSHKESDGFGLADDFTLPAEILSGMANAPSPIPHTPLKTDSGLRTNSDYQRDALSLTGSWDMNPDNTLGLSFSYYDNEYGITPTALYRETRKAGGTAHWYPRYWRFDDWHRYTISLTEESRLSDSLRIKGKVFYDDYESALNAYDDDTYTTQLRTAGAPSFDSTYDDYNAGFNLYLFWDGIQNHHLRMGYSMKRDVHESEYAFSQSPAEHEKLVSSTYSAALEDGITIRDNLTLTLGASYDTFKQDKRMQASGSEKGGAVNTFSPQVGMNFTPSPDVDLYASAGKKIRFPTMRNLYANGVIGPKGNPDLKEERTHAYELGGTWRINTTLTVAGALFYNDVKNLILFNNQIGRFEQYEKATIHGGELSLSVYPMNGLTGTIGYTFLEAKNDNSIVTIEAEYLSSDLVYTPDEIPYRPKHKIDFDLTRSFDFGLKIYLNGSYVADQIFYNHADSGDNRKFVAVKEHLDDYFLLNGKVTYDFSHNCQVFAAVDNILNDDYQELYLSPAQGITAWLGVTLTL